MTGKPERRMKFDVRTPTPILNRQEEGEINLSVNNCLTTKEQQDSIETYVEWH